MENITATEARIKREELLRQSTLDSMIAHFHEKYAPENSYEAGVFAADLHAIVRAVYADMQRPVTKVLENLIMASTTPIYLKTK